MVPIQTCDKALSQGQCNISLSTSVISLVDIVFTEINK